MAFTGRTVHCCVLLLWELNMHPLLLRGLYTGVSAVAVEIYVCSTDATADACL